jgi:hypothetical protein
LLERTLFHTCVRARHDPVITHELLSAKRGALNHLGRGKRALVRLCCKGARLWQYIANGSFWVLVVLHNAKSKRRQSVAGYETNLERTLQHVVSYDGKLGKEDRLF